jgi:hypothetical protein
VRTVNQRAIDEEVYIVELIAEYGDVSAHWNAEQRDHCHIKDVVPNLPWQYLHCIEQEFCCEGV